MQIMSSFFRFVVAIFLALLICFTANAATLYVDDSAPSSPMPDGSLTKPYQTIQDAVAVAQPNQDIIRVGQGTYKPTGQTSGYIELKSGVRIEGGYLGWTGSTFDETRDPATYVTILSGELGNNVFAHHVVIVPASTQPPSSGSVTQKVNLDGVTISDGLTPLQSANPNGAGILIFSGSGQITAPVFRNCIIENNTVGDFQFGGGVFVDGWAHPVFRACVFRSNRAGAGGAALFIGSSTVVNAGTFLNCTFDSNSAYNDGGAVWTCPHSSGVNFISCTFVNNTTELSNGGGILYNGSDTNEFQLRVENCLVVGNSAGESGGAISFKAHGDVKKSTITNCTFTENSAAEQGGAIYLGHANDDVNIINSILWNDTAPDGPEIGYASPPNDLDVSFSNVEGGWTGAGNKNVNPNFVGGGDYHLNCPSGGLGLIDQGNSSDVANDDLDVDENPSTTGPAPDLDFLPRVVGGGSPAKVDMGCYERQLCKGVDVTSDGCVNVQDMLAVINAWGACGSPCPADVGPVSNNACGVGAGDGTVNVQDLLAVLNNWGACPSCPTQTSPPEDVFDCMEYCAEANDYGDCIRKCMCGLGYDTCD